MTLLIMAICIVLFEKFLQFLDKKSPGSKEIFIQNVQNNNIFEIFKMFKNIFKVKLDVKSNSDTQNSMMVSISFVLD